MNSQKSNSPWVRVSPWATATFLGLALGPSAWAAEPRDTTTAYHPIRGGRAEVHANVDRFNMFGAGFRVEVPLMYERVFDGAVRDELALSLGGDLFFNAFDRNYYDGGAYLVPIAAVEWNLYLGRNWSVFPEAGLALHFGVDRDGYGDRARFYLQPDLGVGARYHLDDRFALLLRLSTPGGLQLGLTI